MNNKGMALATTLMVVVLMLTMLTATLRLSMTELKKTYNHKVNAKAFGYAEIGLLWGIKALAFQGLSSGATGFYTVTITDTANPDIQIVESTGLFKEARAVVRSTVEQTYPSFPGAGAAITANGAVETNGTLTIDGRNHDLEGNIIEGGTYGLVTGDGYTQSGDSHVGGSSSGVDYPPTTPGDPDIIFEGAEDLPLTPDGVAGLTEGRLKQLAMSGLNGGQYVTDPSQLSHPLSGVTYVEVEDWWIVGGSPILDGGTGVLVVHNESTTALIQNLNRGTFKGLIIADRIMHVHNTIIGALVSLTTDTSEHQLGNGTGDILYSQIVIDGLDWITDIKLKDWLEVF